MLGFPGFPLRPSTLQPRKLIANGGNAEKIVNRVKRKRRLRM
jgi:hypothetical protein